MGRGERNDDGGFSVIKEEMVEGKEEIPTTAVARRDKELNPTSTYKKPLVGEERLREAGETRLGEWAQTTKIILPGLAWKVEGKWGRW